MHDLPDQEVVCVLAVFFGFLNCFLHLSTTCVPNWFELITSRPLWRDLYSLSCVLAVPWRRNAMAWPCQDIHFFPDDTCQWHLMTIYIILYYIYIYILYYIYIIMYIYIRVYIYNGWWTYLLNYCLLFLMTNSLIGFNPPGILVLFQIRNPHSYSYWCEQSVVWNSLELIFCERRVLKDASLLQRCCHVGQNPKTLQWSDL